MDVATKIKNDIIKHWLVVIDISELCRTNIDLTDKLHNCISALIFIHSNPSISFLF